MDFNFIDVAIAVIILITALIGFMRGLVWMAIFLATWTAAILLAIKYKDALAVELPIKLSNDLMQTGLAGLLIFLAVLMAGAIINYLLNRVINAIGLGAFDRVLGAGLGILLGGFAITLMIMLLSITELPDQELWKQSKFIPRFQEAAEYIRTLVPEDVNKIIDENLDIGSSSSSDSSSEKTETEKQNTPPIK